MPRRKYRRKPKSTWGGYARSAYNVATTAAKALQLAEKVAETLNTEEKHHDKATNFSVNWNGTMQNLNIGIAQGTGPDERTGDQCKSTKICLKYRITADPSASTGQQVRVILFWEPEYENVTANDILETTGSNMAPLSFYNHDHINKVNIIYNGLHNLEAQSNQLITKNICIKDKRRAHRIMKWTEADTTGGATNFVKGFLRMLVISDIDSTGDTPDFSYNLRLFYVDN